MKRIWMLCVLSALAVAASSASDGGGDASPAAETTATTERDIPAGPAADLSKELTGGTGTNIASSTPPEPVLDAAGYEQHEYEAAGTATAYVPNGELGSDGRWSVRPERDADYRTRIIVRRPADPDDASGVVVVEWLNVSGGLDADPEWQMLREDITRHGDVWVGVSAQSIGIEGGPVPVTTPSSEAAGAGRGLKVIDPARYGDLTHPGDDFSYDIFTQVARGLVVEPEPLGGVEPDMLLAAGESQSAFAMVSYVNAVQPIAGVFDGFFIHSRGAPALPLVVDGPAADIAGALAGPATLVRTDTDVPVMELQSETDVTGFFGSVDVRQDDTETFRLWEMAGTAHADTRLIGERAGELGCGSINAGPMHLIAKAAYRALVDWVRDGTAPPEAPRLELDAAAAEPTIARDEHGIALGGIRTPLVDVPVDVLSGAPGPHTDVVCLLSGQTTPLAADTLSARYADAGEYRAQFGASADEVIDAGFVLDEDRAALLDAAQPDRIG